MQFHMQKYLVMIQLAQIMEQHIVLILLLDIMFLIRVL